MAAEAVDRLCAGLLGNLLGMPSAPAPPPAAAGWPGESPAGWEQAWEATTRSLVGQAGAGFQQGRRVREAAIVLALARQAAAVEPGTLHRIVAERIAIERQDRFACDPDRDFWYFKINHGFWEQLYGIHGFVDPTKMRFTASVRYREAYVDSGFAAALESLILAFARDDGQTITFPGMHFGMSLEAGNHDHETVLRRFSLPSPLRQAVVLGATIGLLGVFDTLFGERRLRFADGSFPKRAAMEGTLRETLGAFARVADRVVFVVPPHLSGLALDGAAVPQECLLVPGGRVHACWAAALQAITGQILARLETDDRVLVITQSAVFAALLGLFLRAAKEAMALGGKQIFFFDLGQVLDSATPELGGIWITRHEVGDPSLFYLTARG